MKAEYEYSPEEVLVIVMAAHVVKYPPPDGMVWSPCYRAYSDRTVKVEAVDKEPEGGAG